MRPILGNAKDAIARVPRKAPNTKLVMSKTIMRLHFMKSPQDHASMEP
jgi:hypothetical protein